ncbi:MAG TPA: hypothetical protein VHG32_25250 [Thermoanaerobaculia bacterium]|jgi:hypothetical protein|nr:hypothetical protein [Thermoanaerobaculia bacterium]
MLDATPHSFSQPTALVSPHPTTREEWLLSAVDQLRPSFLAHGVAVPVAVHVSIGFPSTGALARRRRRIGECWPAEASPDGLHHLFVSPLLAEPVPVLATLVHELVHAAVGNRAGHGPPFRRLALALGLHGRMTATSAGPELAARLADLAVRLGTFPHAALLPNPYRKKQTTRLHKVACPQCDYTVRITAKWIAAGLPVCPCGAVMCLNGPASRRPAANTRHPSPTRPGQQ